MVKYFLGCLLFICSNPIWAQLNFVENKGQWEKGIQYKSEFSNGAFFIEENGFMVLLHHSDDLNQIAAIAHGTQQSKLNINEKKTLRSHAYRVSFIGAEKNCTLLPEKKMNTYNNYFLGNDQSKWAGNCRIYQGVTYKNIYPQIDLRYYSLGDQLKYDFILNPGADPSAIKIEYTGAEKLLIKNNELLISTSAGELKESSPYSYQINDNGIKQSIQCDFVLNGNTILFKLDKYNPHKKLIIDPTLIFSTFTGSTSDNWGYTATPGPDGTFFAGGISFGNGYPVSTGAFQTTFANGVYEGSLKPHDISIMKFSSNGDNRLYATYIGGRFNEQPHSMIVDANGNLIVAGRSSSSDYPTTIPLIGSGGNNDIVITKFNATGTALIGSVRIGGTGNDGVNIRSKYESPDGADRLRQNYGDDARSEVILDNENNIILASCTQSANFPTRGNALNPNNAFGGGLQDGLVLKFNANLSAYLFGSFFGGTGDDGCFSSSIDPITNNLYVAGGTTSSNLPGNQPGVLYSSYRGGITDGFVLQMRLDGTGTMKSTYIGTNGMDIVYGLKFDKYGYPYVMGTTTGTWPIINAAFSKPNSAQFICKLKPDLSGFVYSTVFGNGIPIPNLSPIGFLVDRCENVYVTGWGGGINVFKNYSNGTTNTLPLLNPLSSVGAPDGEDFYFFVMKRDAVSQLFGSNFGQFRGNTGDHVDGGTSRFDFNGTIYQAICANCNGGAVFPTTTGAWQRTNGSTNCNLAAVKVAMDFAGVAAGVRPSINTVRNDTAGCIPFRVDFSDTLLKGKKIYWDFGNGLKDTTTAPNFSTFTNYTAVGNYIVTIIAEDSTTCNIRDTIRLKIKAGDNKAVLQFNSIKDLPCTSLSYTFNNLSTSTSGNFLSNSFIWDFGDGSPPQIAFNGNHTFPSIGTYTVTLTLTDENFCNAPEKTTMIINVNPLVDAKLFTPPVGCAPYEAQFINQSGTTDVTWEFSDGTSTNTENPIKTFSTPGQYQVRIIARDPNTCNKIDTSDYFTFTVSEKPTANFSWQPNPPERNTPTRFTNLSTGAVRYLWNFGDGASSQQPNPTHQYTSTGTFTASLIAYNAFNCTDTFSLPVSTLIDALLDVPNAFTPGKNGENAVIKVKGFGIAKLDWKIYNRWGQLIFQSNDIDKGWDGTYKGKLQSLDVFVYTLDAVLTDGSKVKKTGDITLIR